MHSVKKIVVALALVLVALPLLGGTASVLTRSTGTRTEGCLRQGQLGRRVPGLCTKSTGSVSLPDFRAQLAKGGSGAWWIRQHEITLDAGDSVAATNVGGIIHTFTEVQAYGKGCVPEWNTAIKETVDNCDFFGKFLPTLVPSGTTNEKQVLPVGVHLFQCLVHPWMRTVVTVRATCLHEYPRRWSREGPAATVSAGHACWAPCHS